MNISRSFQIQSSSPSFVLKNTQLRTPNVLLNRFAAGSFRPILATGRCLTYVVDRFSFTRKLHLDYGYELTTRHTVPRSFLLKNTQKYHYDHGLHQKTKPFSLILPDRNTNSSCTETNENKKNDETSYEILGSGMILLKNYISLPEQVDIVNICQEYASGFYQPGYESGAKLKLHMMCFGRKWDPQTLYRYKKGDSEAPPVPDKLVSLVETSIKDSQVYLNSEDELPSMYPDICIVNFYTTTGKLGLHQDRDESANSLKSGLPVVSISIGDSAEFLYGHTRNVNNADKVLLESGDVLLFGGKSRHIYHGVSTIIPNSAPDSLVEETMLRPGRLNLTLRQF